MIYMQSLNLQKKTQILCFNVNISFDEKFWICFKNKLFYFLATESNLNIYSNRSTRKVMYLDCINVTCNLHSSG